MDTEDIVKMLCASVYSQKLIWEITETSVSWVYAMNVVCYETLYMDCNAILYSKLASSA